MIAPYSTPIHPGIIARVASGVRYAVTGKTPSSWFGPGEPLKPIAQEVAGRQFDFPVATNIQTAPRAHEPVSFADLRGLAEVCDIVRLAIETRKDQMAKLIWAIQPKDKTALADKRIAELATFFAYPDKEHDWYTWLRMLLEDLLVIDAPVLYVRLNNGNTPYAFEPIDGATIKRLLDEKGRMPAAPDPSYQQVLHGVPAVDYSSAELIYLPRNVRTHKIYGFSPVEQIIITINTLIRKSIHQQQYYTEGSVPDSIIGVPPSWQPDQIAAFQRYWDEELAGNTANRRRVKFVADGVNFHPTKTEPLKDEFDDWLARIVCYAFSLPPTPFIKEQNRATAETVQDAALQEGLAPLMQWVKSLMDRIIALHFGYADLEFTWLNEKESDPLIQAQINQIYVMSGIKTPDEVRVELGLEVTPSSSTKLMKCRRTVLRPINRQRLVIQTTRRKFALALTDLFTQEKRQIAEEIAAAYAKVQKADDIDDILDNLDMDAWTAIVTTTRQQLATATQDGGTQALKQLKLSNDTLEERVAETASKEAAYRAAELVGKKYVDGELVDNPNAKWVITDNTRELLRADIEQAMEEGWSTDRLADAIEDNYAFSEARADMIARTEIARADMNGSMIAYRESGIVSGKEWLLGGNPCPICEENASEGVIPLDQAFSSGDGMAPAHPNCTCSTSPVVAPLEDE